MEFATQNESEGKNQAGVCSGFIIEDIQLAGMSGHCFFNEESSQPLHLRDGETAHLRNRLLVEALRQHLLRQLDGLGLRTFRTPLLHSDSLAFLYAYGFALFHTDSFALLHADSLAFLHTNGLALFHTNGFALHKTLLEPIIGVQTKGDAHAIPEIIIGIQLRIGVGGAFQNIDRLAYLRTLQHLRRHVARVLVYLRKVPEPQDHHLLVHHRGGIELLQLHEDDVQPFDHMVGAPLLHQPEDVHEIGAVKRGALRKQNRPLRTLEGVLRQVLVQQAQRVDRHAGGIVLALAQLATVRPRRVVQYALEEVRRPHHLHLHDELALERVGALHIHDGILPGRRVRQHLRRLVLDGAYPLIPAEIQQGVQKADRQLLMFAKHTLERQVGFGIQILGHRIFVFILSQI